MKSRLVFVLAGIALLASVQACKKSPSNGIDEVLSRTGVVAYQGAGLYVSTGEGEGASLEWRAALDFGGALKLPANLEPREFSLGTSRFSFAPVALDSGALEGLAAKLGQGPCWVRLDYYGSGAEAAVVVTDTAASGGTNSALKRGQLVAAKRTRGGAGALPVILIDDMTKARLPDAMVDPSKLSFAREDVRAATLLAKASAARDEAEARAILEDAERSSSASVFAADIRARLGAGAGEAPSGPVVEELVAKLTVKRDAVPVLSAPAADASRLGTLAMDDEVDTAARTVETATTDAGTAHWYRITSPFEGWIFGLDLVGAD